ncbi:MAG TPA: hypothetical protein VFG73_11685 [Rhodanobacteraceae bacterium]|nr:hypothetical protein [Rhodanobacteraceae bacterium]
MLAAEQLSDEELESRAKAGDSKAAAFLAERRIKQVGPADAVTDVWSLEPEVVSSGSPFGGYFHARVKKFVATMENPDDPGTVARLAAYSRIVGYQWAASLGDTRVSMVSPSR